MRLHYKQMTRQRLVVHYRVELGYNVTKGDFVSLQTSVVITEEYNVVSSVELTGTTEYVTLYTRCRINRCRYNRVRLYIIRHLYISCIFCRYKRVLL
jgi:hypothetical protein